MKVKFFYKKDCPKCPAAKEALERFFPDLPKELHDIDTVEGLAEGAYYQVMSTPSILIVDSEEREVKSWRGEVPTLSEVKDLLPSLKVLFPPQC
jgi:glutaredoxin